MPKKDAATDADPIADAYTAIRDHLDTAATDPVAYDTACAYLRLAEEWTGVAVEPRVPSTQPSIAYRLQSQDPRLEEPVTLEEPVAVDG